jgi:uncharacterized membrane protein YidH (DUF202 family)
MAPSLILWCVANPISDLPLVGEREHESLAFTAVELGLRAASLGIGAMLFHSLTAGLVVLCLMAVLLYTAAIWRFLRIASVTLRELVRPAARIVALTLPFMGLVTLVGLVSVGAVLLATLVGWATAIGLAARLTPEVKVLLSGSHD